MFRNLKESEIECKIALVKEKGIQVLLYKTARTDMDLLDETVKPYNWQCRYETIKDNLYCTISIYDAEKKMWVEKSDCGVESAFGDKEKGEASDAFKRAGFKWGIGRELYTAPFIWIAAEFCDIKKNGEKFVCYDRFEVEKIETTDGKIKKISIINSKTKARVFLQK